MNTGDKIKLLREREKMSQADLGARLGVKRAAINKYKKGTVENIPFRNLEKIADIFNVTPQYLVGWADEQKDMDLETIVSLGVTTVYGDYGMHILNSYLDLDTAGRRKLLLYIKDLLKLHHK